MFGKHCLAPLWIEKCAAEANRVTWQRAFLISVISVKKSYGREQHGPLSYIISIIIIITIIITVIIIFSPKTLPYLFGSSWTEKQQVSQQVALIEQNLCVTFTAWTLFLIFLFRILYIRCMNIYVCCWGYEKLNK